MTLSTHVLDTSRGRPVAGVRVRLDTRREGDWHPIARGQTDSDGRIAGWQTDGPAVYRMVFAVGDYLGEEAFYPEVTVSFRIAAPSEHYHVPLLLSPFGYTTYRGS